MVNSSSSHRNAPRPPRGTGGARGGESSSRDFRIFFLTSGQCRHRVGPGLELCPDAVVRVRGEAHALPAEGDHVDLPVRVVALQGRGEGVPCRVVDRSAVVGRVQAGSPGQGRDTGIVSCDCVEGVRGIAPLLCVGVLVHDLRRVRFLGLLYRLVIYTGGLIGCAGKRVAGKDRLDDRVERRHVCDGGCECSRC